MRKSGAPFGSLCRTPFRDGRPGIHSTPSSLTSENAGVIGRSRKSPRSSERGGLPQSRQLFPSSKYRSSARLAHHSGRPSSAAGDGFENAPCGRNKITISVSGSIWTINNENRRFAYILISRHYLSYPCRDEKGDMMNRVQTLSAAPLPATARRTASCSSNAAGTSWQPCAAKADAFEPETDRLKRPRSTSPIRQHPECYRRGHFRIGDDRRARSNMPGSVSSAPSRLPR